MWPLLDVVIAPTPPPSSVGEYGYSDDGEVMKLSKKLHDMNIQVEEMKDISVDMLAYRDGVDREKVYYFMMNVSSSARIFYCASREMLICGNKMSNAFGKMYEMLHRPDFEELCQKKELKVLHLAEAPGMFILAMMAYLNQVNPSILRNGKYTWYANSLPPDGGDEFAFAALSDYYGLIESFKSRWILGSVTDPKLVERCHDRLMEDGGLADLVTGDIGIEVKNWRDEEMELFGFEYGQFVSGIYNLKEGGMALYKMFTAFLPPAISILRLASGLFDSVRIVKPAMSHGTSNETYWILKGFHRKDAEKLFPSIMKRLAKVDKLLLKREYSPPLVPESDMTHEFMESVEKLGMAQNVLLNYGVYINDSLLKKFWKPEYASKPPPVEDAIRYVGDCQMPYIGALKNSLIFPITLPKDIEGIVSRTIKSHKADGAKVRRPREYEIDDS